MILRRNFGPGVIHIKILFTNPTPMIKYGMQKGFEKNGWETDRIEVPGQTEEGLIKKIGSFRPDYLFTEGGVDTKGFVFPVLERLPVPHIYWAVEDPVANSTLAMEWAARSVLTLTPDVEMLEEYHKKGHKAICIPFAADPDYYYKYPKDPFFSSLDALHVGNNYDVFPERCDAYEYIIRPFMDNGKALAVYGFDWDNPKHRFTLSERYNKGYLPHEKSVVAYSSAKITLGVHSIVNSRTMQSMRTFEVLGCGGFFLTQRTLAVKTMFEDHKHLVASSGYGETVALMNYYLSHDAAREKIALAGQKFVYENHSYEKRAAQIIASL